MINKLLILVVLASLYAKSYAQISYEKTYAAAKKKAQATKKPIFIILTPSGKPKGNHQDALDKPEESQFFNENFINLTLNAEGAEASRLSSLYNITVFPSYIFINDNESLIFKRSINKVQNGFFIDLGNEIMDRIHSGNTLYQLDQKYANGEISRQFLKDYISLRIKTGTTDNASLIEKYVEYLTISEFNEPGEILFIFKAGPILSGNAYKLLHHNRQLALDIFATLPLSERITINGRIAANSLDEAIASKNLALAMQSAGFARNSHGTDYKTGDKRHNWSMMRYYKEVKDTSNFFSLATRYYDGHYMTISRDSINSANLKAATTGNANLKDNTAAQLNNAAWEFYELGTKNQLYLSKALLWSKRSIEINPEPDYFNTLAHIFYRMKFFEEALLNENKALAKTQFRSDSKNKATLLKRNLKKMKERKL